MQCNLLLIGNDPDKAPATHPSYLTYRHVNPILHAMSKVLTADEITRVRDGYRRSDFSEEALINDYLRGNVPHHKIVKDEHYTRALLKTTDLFRPIHTYRPVAFPDLRYYPWTLPTSAEAPYTNSEYWKAYVKEKFNRGEISDARITFHNLYNEIFRHNREKVHRIKDGTYVDRHGNDLMYWNQAHARSHLVEKDEPDKIRMVFGVPKLLLMVEAMFLWPLINDLLSRDSPMLWGFETLRGGWYAMYNWFSNRPDHITTYLALDWKQFDKRAQFELIDDMHDTIRSYIDFENGYIPTKDYPESSTNPDRLRRLFKWMTDAVKGTPDVLPNGDTYQRTYAGIASGYFETQLLDSMVNTQMLNTVLSSLGINIDKMSVKVQGDDSIIGLVERIPPEMHDSFLDMIAAKAEHYFGAILNTKKSKISNSLDGLPLLGFTNKNGIPTRPRDQLLANLLYPERKSDEPRLMARCVGIAYANCGHHSSVYKICEDTFRYLEEQGYSPNASGLPLLIQTMSNWQEVFTNDGDLRFPTFYDTFRRLTEIPKRSESQRQRMWPTNHFLSTY